MPRIANKNPRFRTKVELCRDIAFVLNSPVKYGTKYAVLVDATWTWTEFEGKYVGCEHWSEAAWKIQGQQNLLVHEHVMPKSLVIQRLLDLSPNATEDSVNQLLTAYCKGAVITREEDARLNGHGLRAKMPHDWDEKDVWARYKFAGIVLRIVDSAEASIARGEGRVITEQSMIELADEVKQRGRARFAADPASRL